MPSPRPSAALPPRPPDPLTLRLFVAVCEERSIAAAAQREALVASAVSKRIAALEADLGTPLLLRGRRGIAPTPAGEALLRRARELLGSLQRLRAELDEFAGGAQGSVRVVASLSALAESLPEDIAAFLAQRPTLRVSLDERLSHAAAQAVRLGQADIAVVWDATPLHGLHDMPYRRDHLCAVMRHDHPLARRRRLRYAQTLEHPAVGMAPDGTVAELLRREAQRLGRQPDWRIQVSSLDVACRIVAAGLGLAILPREAVLLPARALDLVLVPLADAWATRRFVIACGEPAGLPAATRQLVAFLQGRNG